MEKKTEQQDIPQDNEIIYVDINELQPNPYQPESRLEVPEEVAKKFGLSILEHGLLQMPVATISSDHYEMGDGWLRRSGFEWLTKNGHPEYSKSVLECSQTRNFPAPWDSMMPKPNTSLSALQPK
jgi:hypothetical protein